MRGRVFGEFYRKQAYASHGIHAKKRLAESAELQSFQRLWQEANSFMRERENEVVDLPADSPEKLRIKATSGILQKFKPDDGDSPEEIRNKLDSLGNELESASAPGTGAIQQYISGLLRGVRELYVQIDPSAESPQSPQSPQPQASPQSPQSPQPQASPQSPQPQQPQKSDSQELADALGINESVLMRRRLKGLVENDELIPGQTVSRVVDGKLVKMQVILDANGQVAVVDPLKLDKVDKVRREEVAPNDDPKNNTSRL